MVAGRMLSRAMRGRGGDWAEAGGRSAGRWHDRRVLPVGIDGKAFLSRLESRFGIKVAGGQGPLKDKIFRIAHMGMIDELDVISTVAAFELVLAEMGQSVELGAGAAAASQVIAQGCEEPKSCDVS